MFFTILPEVKNMLSSDTHVSVSAPANAQTNEGGKKNANVVSVPSSSGLDEKFSDAITSAKEFQSPLHRG